MYQYLQVVYHFGHPREVVHRSQSVGDEGKGEASDGELEHPVNVDDAARCETEDFTHKQGVARDVGRREQGL